MLCLQFGHSNVECIQRCALCQARTHKKATCEYNLLARRNAPAVRAVEPVQVQNWGQRNINRFHNGNRGGRLFQRNGRPFQRQWSIQKGRSRPATRARFVSAAEQQAVGSTETGKGPTLLSPLSTWTLRERLPTPSCRPNVKPRGSVDE
jgi:hypothetical protein